MLWWGSHQAVPAVREWAPVSRLVHHRRRLPAMRPALRTRAGLLDGRARHQHRVVGAVFVFFFVIALGAHGARRPGRAAARDPHSTHDHRADRVLPVLEDGVDGVRSRGAATHRPERTARPTALTRCRHRARSACSAAGGFLEPAAEVLPLGVGRGQVERFPVRVGRFGVAFETAQQVGTRRGKQVIAIERTGSCERVDDA